jgi:hypothetical protein
MSLLTREWKWWPLNQFQFNLLYVHTHLLNLVSFESFVFIFVDFFFYLFSNLVYYSFSLLYLSLSSSLISNILFSNLCESSVKINFSESLFISNMRLENCFMKIWYYTFTSLNKTNILYQHLYSVFYFANILVDIILTKK